MKIRNALVAAALVAVAVGGLVAGAGGSSPPFGATPPSFVVPVARMGDEVQYAIQWRETQDAGGSPVDWSGAYGLSLRVRGVEVALDRTGDAHDAVAVEWSKAGDLYHPGFLAEPSPGVSWIDLSTREIVQVKWWANLRLSDAHAAGTEYRYGPLAEDPYGYARPHVRTGLVAGLVAGSYATSFLESNVSFEVQGGSFTVGDDLTARALQGVFLANLESGASTYWDYDRVVDYSFASRLEGHGHIGPYEVFALVREVSLDYVNVQRTEYLAGFEGAPEARWHEKHTTRYWLSPEIPWPVRIERDVVREGDDPYVPPRFSAFEDPVRNYSVVQDLVAYEPGDQPVPWVAWEPGHFRSEDETAERAPPGTDHVVGGEGRFPYAYDEAVANLQDDASLQEFRDWLARHPEARLAGTAMYRGLPYVQAWPPDDSLWAEWDLVTSVADSQTRDPASEPWDTWQFTYAVPGPTGSADQAYMVTTSRGQESATVANGDWGASSLPPEAAFAAEDLPNGAVTLAYADIVWQAMTPAGGGEQTPGLFWGLGCVLTADPFSASGGGVRPACGGHRSHLDQIRVAAGGYEYTFDGMPPQPRATSNVSWMELAAGTGHVTRATFGWEYRDDGFLTATVGDIGPFSDDASPSTAPYDGHRFDRVGPATLAAASAFSLFLLAYFFPILRYVGAGLLGVVPGYAKLKRNRLLDNDFRERIVALVRQEPGISPPELHRHVGGAWSTVVYHLRVLEKHRVLSSTIDGRHKRFFPTGEIDRRDVDALSVLRNERTREFFDIIGEAPGTHQSELARQVGISSVAARWHLHRLKGAGLIGDDTIGRKVCYYPLRPAPPVDGAMEIT